MKSKEIKILVEVANDIRWMKDKQITHDKKLDIINEKLEKGAGKIEANREAINALDKKTESILKYGVGAMATLVTIFSGIIGWIINKLE